MDHNVQYRITDVPGADRLLGTHWIWDKEIQINTMYYN